MSLPEINTPRQSAARPAETRPVEARPPERKQLPSSTMGASRFALQHFQELTRQRRDDEKKSSLPPLIIRGAPLNLASINEGFSNESSGRVIGHYSHLTHRREVKVSESPKAPARRLVPRPPQEPRRPQQAATGSQTERRAPARGRLTIGSPVQSRGYIIPSRTELQLPELMD